MLGKELARLPWCGFLHGCSKVLQVWRLDYVGEERFQSGPEKMYTMGRHRWPEIRFHIECKYILEWPKQIFKYMLSQICGCLSLLSDWNKLVEYSCSSLLWQNHALYGFVIYLKTGTDFCISSWLDKLVYCLDSGSLPGVPNCFWIAEILASTASGEGF